MLANYVRVCVLTRLHDVFITALRLGYDQDIPTNCCFVLTTLYWRIPAYLNIPKPAMLFAKRQHCKIATTSATTTSHP